MQLDTQLVVAIGTSIATVLLAVPPIIRALREVPPVALAVTASPTL